MIDRHRLLRIDFLAHLPEHQFVHVDDGIAVFEFVNILHLDIANAADERDFAAAREHFGIIKALLAGDKPSRRPVLDLGPQADCNILL